MTGIPGGFETGTPLRLGYTDTEPAPIRSVTDSGYRSAVGRSWILIFLFAAWVVLAGVAAAASIAEFRIADRLITNPLSISVAAINASSDRQTVIALSWLAGYLVTGVVFIVWMLRIYDNVSPLGQVAPRHSRGWAIGGWFVPLLNLWRPKQIMDDLWTASDLPPAAREADEGRPALPVLDIWWALFIIGGFLGYVVARAAEGTSLEASRTAAGIDVIVDLIFMGSAIAGALVVWFTTQRQDIYASGHFIDFHRPAPIVGYRRALSLAAVAFLVGIAVTVGAAVAFDASTEDLRRPEATDVEAGITPAPGTPTALADLRAGDCWYEPGVADPEIRRLLAVEVVACEQPHHGEVFARLTMPQGTTEPYPGDEAVSAETLLLCAAAMETTHGISYESSTLDIFRIVPLGDGWELGDRSVICSTMAMDGGLLSATAAELDSPVSGSDLPILAATSCDELVTTMVGTAQLLVDTVESMTAAEMASLGVTTREPGLDRVAKRSALMQGMAHRLGCSTIDLNTAFAERSHEIETTTADGLLFVETVVENGFWS